MNENRTVIVTGGAKGIGGSCSRVFYRNGWNVAILDIDELGDRLAGELGERALFIRTDVSSESAVIDAMAQVKEKFGETEVLVNSAGIQRYSTVTQTTEEEWDLVMNVNLKSAFLCAKHSIPSMKRLGRGLVVNVSSVQAFITQNNVAPYTTSKTAMLGLTRSIAVDYAPEIRSVAICPGTVDTPMLRSAIRESPDPEVVLQECIDMHLTHRIGTSDEIAELIYFLSEGKMTFLTGQSIRVDGGLGLRVAGSKRD